MNLTDEDLRTAVLAELQRAEILDVQESDIVILEPEDGFNGRWHLLPLGPTHGYWYPDGKASILICDGMLELQPSDGAIRSRYYCEECEESYARF